MFMVQLSKSQKKKSLRHRCWSARYDDPPTASVSRGYLAAKHGFRNNNQNGRIYLVEGSANIHDGIVEFRRNRYGHWCRSNNMTIRSDSRETIADYLVSKPGFAVNVKWSHLCVKADSKNNHDGVVEIPEKEMQNWRWTKWHDDSCR